MHQLFIDFKKTYDLVRRGALYNALIASDYDQFRKTYTYKKSTAITVNPLNPASGTVTIRLIESTTQYCIRDNIHDVMNSTSNPDNIH